MNNIVLVSRSTNNYIGIQEDKRKFGLDFVRALAILLVIFAHAGIFFIGTFNYIIENSGLGFFGVEFFFVLSGFLIGQILLREFAKSNEFSTVRKFWIRRWFRTLPNYYIFLFLETIVILNVIPNYFEFFSWDYLSYYFLLQNITSPMNVIYFFTLSWTLAVEEWFYILIALLIFCLMCIRKNSSKAVIYSAIALILFSTIMRVVFAHYFSDYRLNDLRMIMPLRLDAIAWGVVAAYIKYSYISAWGKNRIAFAIIGFLMLCGCFMIMQSVVFRELFLTKIFIFSLVSIFSALCLPLFDTWNIATSWFKKWVHSISAWSYSIYLSHSIILLVFNIFFLTKIPQSFLFARICLFFSYLMVLLMVSSFIYLKLEKPMLDFRDK